MWLVRLGLFLPCLGLAGFRASDSDDLKRDAAALSPAPLEQGAEMQNPDSEMRPRDKDAKKTASKMLEVVQSDEEWAQAKKKVNDLWPTLCTGMSPMFQNYILTVSKTIFLYENGLSPLGFIVGSVIDTRNHVFEIEAVCAEPGYGRKILEALAEVWKHGAIALDALSNVIVFYLKSGFHMGAPCESPDESQIILETKAKQTRVTDPELQEHFAKQTGHPLVQLIVKKARPAKSVLEYEETIGRVDFKQEKSMYCNSNVTASFGPIEDDLCDVYYWMQFGFPMQRCLS